MNLELTDEQVALRETVRRFLAEKASVAAHVRPMLDNPCGTTDEVWQGLAALGATGVLVPEEFGGAGMTMVEAGVVAEELGAALHPGPWLSSAVAATRALTRMGAEARAAELLAGIADGSTIATVGPLDGARPTALDTGNGVVLRGEVAALPDAAAADVLLVLADGRPRNGIVRRRRRDGWPRRRGSMSIRRASCSMSCWTMCLRGASLPHRRRPSRRSSTTC